MTPKSPPKFTHQTLADSVDGVPFRSKEVSWLSFNERVLQEAADRTVPVLERLKFLGIYSSNLDEFFRVRVATLKRLAKLGKHFKKLQIPNPSVTLNEVNKIVNLQSEEFNRVYDRALKDLKEHGIVVINEEEVPEKLKSYLTGLFMSEIRPKLMPILLKTSSLLAGLKDYPMYLAVRMSRKSGKSRPAHALLEIPSDQLPRFVVLPKVDDRQLIMYLDDIIRFGIASVFSSTSYAAFEAYAIKFSRDAEIELDDDVTESVYEKVSEGLRARETASPVRLNYDSNMPESFLRLLRKNLNITGEDTLFPGARYHNRKDLMKFPRLGRDDLCFPAESPIPHHELSSGKRGIIQTLQRRDILLHLPYHSFNTFLDLLREASIDPLVREISITQYRLARHSCVATALVNAVKNGKQVTVVVEPTARFDEKANIAWANTYQAAGVQVILGVAGLKVHAKLCLISRLEGGNIKHYSCIGTGNFNEETANLYTDHLLMTSDFEIGSDVAKAFRFMRNSYQPPRFHRLISAPLSLRQQMMKWIHTEIKNAKNGKPAEIFIKLNNLSDLETVKILYRASRAGVKIKLIVRSMFSTITQLTDHSENIRAISIVDKRLEHSRIFIFANGGKPKYLISSADLLPRNYDSRFEIVCPIHDKRLQEELRHYMNIQWHDTTKARILDESLSNQMRKPKKKDDEESHRAQVEIADYLRDLMLKKKKKKK